MSEVMVIAVGSESATLIFAGTKNEMIKEAVKAIEFDELPEYLPFKVDTLAGENYIHLTNESVFPVETRHHVITQGVTLCGRNPVAPSRLSAVLRNEPCPGCTAHGRSLAAKALGYDPEKA
jgi:hypothetical protein